MIPAAPPLDSDAHWPTLGGTLVVGSETIVRTVIEINGTKRRARALINTGAEATLVGFEWLSDEELQPARHALTLIRADGTQMAGGKKSFEGGLSL